MDPISLDDRGIPRLVRAVQVPAAPASTLTESAIKHLTRLAAAWGVNAAAMPTLEPAGEVAVVNGTIVRLKQTIGGIPLHRGEVRVLVRANGELVVVSGTLVGADRPRAPARWDGDDADAVARSVAHKYQKPFRAAALAQHQLRSDGTRVIRGGDGAVDVELARARRAWHDTGDMLVPVWVVEAYASEGETTNGDAFATVTTVDGRVLSHRSLTADVAFNYRVFAETTGEFHPFDGPIADFSPHPAGVPNGTFPDFVAPNLVSVEGLNHPPDRSTPDPWLEPGATETNGNNVDAYVDVAFPSGMTFGDFRATLTGTRTFDRQYRTALPPLSSQSQQMASVTSLFYGINWQHDFWYDAGFTEAAGNAQDRNFGRGGEDRDALLAEAQDNAIGPNNTQGSLNNANMSTPEDGLQPRMQVFIWSPGVNQRLLTIQPTNRTIATNYAQYGSINFDRTAPLALAQDGVGAPTDACSPLTNNVTGAIVLVDRAATGVCTVKQQTLNVQNAGGVAVLVAHNIVGAASPRLPEDLAITQPISIGTLGIAQASGTLLKQDIAAGGATATARRVSGPEADGGLDSTLIAHEFGHYLHHRLQDCNTTFCSAISEGWGDFNALLSMARAGDNLDGAYPFSIYTTRSFNADSGYFGIRRAPYSVTPTINGFTYNHMAQNAVLPNTFPRLAGGNNAEVHNAGEIWTATMWEVYVALQKAGQQAGIPFDTIRAKMARYVVQGLLLAPKDGTPTETRDAILAAASEEDRPVMIAAFARRGMGTCALTPARTSINFNGIVESSRIAGNALAGAFKLDDSVRTCDAFRDNILDGGEAGKLTVLVSNNGHAALSNVRVTATSGTPGLTVVSGPVQIAALGIGASQSLSVDVQLDRTVTAPGAAALTLTVESQNGCVESFQVPFATRINLDEVANSSATDAFDATSVWKPTAQTAVWTQRRSASLLEGEWHADDVGGISDTTLESPNLVVGTAPLIVTFQHAFDFEFSDNIAWDGGVVEYSENGGATWQDVTTAGAVPGYNFTLGGANAGNVLLGRQGFGGRSAGAPAKSTVTLDFGTRLAGKTIKLRFRQGTDAAVSAPGWDIDNLAVQGITNLPFPTQVPNRRTCLPRT